MEDEPVCPNCGSQDISHDPTSIISRLSLDESRVCNDCGYSGMFPVVAEDEVASFGEEVAAQEDIVHVEPDFNRGRFLIGLVLLLLGLFASTYATWGNGLLAGLLSLAIGAAIVFEQLSRR